MSPDLGRPEMYLWQNIAVPPVCIRPSVQQDDTSNEDDITVKLTEVIFTNAHMQAGLNQGIAIHNLMVCICPLAILTTPLANVTRSILIAVFNQPLGTMGLFTTLGRHVYQQ